MKTRFTALIFCLIVLTIAGPASALEPGDGYIKTANGKIWYRVVGSGDATPLLLLHGGPGVPSDYLDGMKLLADDRPVIFYDQLGCGRSDRTNDTSLWSIDYFVTEIDTVRKALGLEKIHLYGHSWGTILGAEYMFRKPEGVQSLILASPALSIPRWVADADTLVATLPDSMQKTIAECEVEETFDTPAYQAAVGEYYSRYLARKQPWSAHLDTAFANIGQGVYVYMCGPNEFTISGTLKDYDCTDRLDEITVPTLLICGQFDEARPQTVAYYQSKIPNSQMVIIENAGHLTMHDQPEENAKAIRKFLQTVEKK
jgi:proline iminopeptidase